MHALRSRYPGSETSGVPASVTSATRRLRGLFREFRGESGFVVLVVGDQVFLYLVESE